MQNPELSFCKDLMCSEKIESTENSKVLESDLNNYSLLSEAKTENEKVFVVQRFFEDININKNLPLDSIMFTPSNKGNFKLEYSYFRRRKPSRY